MSEKYPQLNQMNIEMEVQMSELLQQNKNLLSELKIKEEELQQIKDMTEAAFGLNGQNIFTQKLVDSAKKNRALNLALQREKLNYKTLNEKLSETQKQLQERETKDYNEINQKLTLQKKSLKDKNAQTQKLLSHYQTKFTTCESDKKLLEKLLQSEVGQNADQLIQEHQQHNNIKSGNVNDNEMNSKAPSWKGRAEQICKLKDQIQQLKDKQMSGPSSISNSPNRRQQQHINQITSVKNQEIIEMQRLNQLSVQQIEDLQNKIETHQSRRSYLETEVGSLKQKIQILLEKSKNDDNFIKILKQEIQKKLNRENDNRPKPLNEQNKIEVANLNQQIKDLKDQICLQAKLIRQLQGDQNHTVKQSIIELSEEIKNSRIVSGKNKVVELRTTSQRKSNPKILQNNVNTQNQQLLGQGANKDYFKYSIDSNEQENFKRQLSPQTFSE